MALDLSCPSPASSLASRARGTCKRLTLGLLSVSGVHRLAECLTSRGLLVLTYHRVIPRDGRTAAQRPGNTLFDDEFEEQMAYVAKRYHVLGGEELRAIIEKGGAIPRYSLAISFDDGYENNFSHALPILRRHGLHAFFFVTANLIGGVDRSFWFDRLDRLLSFVPAGELRERLRRLDSSFSIPPHARIHSYFKMLPGRRQQEMMDDLEREFGSTGVPAVDKVLYGLMNWDQVRSMVSAGMTIGSHTANHQILSVVSPAEVRMELESSRMHIERETGQPCWCFAYPNGECRDFRPSDELAVRDAGYLCAFTQIRGSINRQSPRYALPRIPTPDTGDMMVFRTYLSGIQRAFRAVFPER